ncbi:hypothetical protein ID866_6253 [Astraeus odoratus]|nr:hypothetical protein ID866_6253 [Astraeus odoratus]
MKVFAPVIGERGSISGPSVAFASSGNSVFPPASKDPAVCNGSQTYSSDVSGLLYASAGVAPAESFREFGSRDAAEVPFQDRHTSFSRPDATWALGNASAGGPSSKKSLSSLAYALGHVLDAAGDVPYALCESPSSETAFNCAVQDHELEYAATSSWTREMEKSLTAAALDIPDLSPQCNNLLSTEPVPSLHCYVLTDADTAFSHAARKLSLNDPSPTFGVPFSETSSWSEGAVVLRGSHQYPSPGPISIDAQELCSSSTMPPSRKDRRAHPYAASARRTTYPMRPEYSSGAPGPFSPTAAHTRERTTTLDSNFFAHNHHAIPRTRVAAPHASDERLVHAPEVPLVIKCPWRNKEGIVCNVPISVTDCPFHLADCHDIRDMPSSKKIECCACLKPNSMKRESILRHFIEIHFKIKRKPSGGKGKGKEKEKEKEKEFETCNGARTISAIAGVPTQVP